MREIRYECTNQIVSLFSIPSALIIHAIHFRSWDRLMSFHLSALCLILFSEVMQRGIDLCCLCFSTNISFHDLSTQSWCFNYGLLCTWNMWSHTAVYRKTAAFVNWHSLCASTFFVCSVCGHLHVHLLGFVCLYVWLLSDRTSWGTRRCCRLPARWVWAAASPPLLEVRQHGRSLWLNWI